MKKVNDILNIEITESDRTEEDKKWAKEYDSKQFSTYTTVAEWSDILKKAERIASSKEKSRASLSTLSFYQPRCSALDVSSPAKKRQKS